ncbi:hypothetical protein HXA34_20730 [Salipaludibacillus agaradhaerens]|uniref:hypothetical protein n=1 Tax=Salipaludibacillus agaradhaerens TaxID=76935 RepID=UPI002150F2DF|nr:hypothetical protein [Salipaludibacillus agaradhaerens]MCR6108726.1 hypothetical protein [Salipaludibacillus agaradhaerens]MCR6120749.1 hypothetical protein [Salipaludibacillus agaradhaerens]
MSYAPTRGLSNLMNKNKRREKESETKQRDDARIRDYPLFRDVKPKSKFLFRSDYFQVDGSYATILTIMHHSGADDNLGYFWGINLIPRSIGNDVSVRRIEHVGRTSESWVEQHQGRAEGLLNNQANETERDGSFTARQKLNKKQQQLLDIANDLMNGASYLRVAMRLLVKAPTLERLDDAVKKINRQYKDRFDTVFAAPYIGEQKRELSNVFNKVEDKMGRNFMFTSSEFAGNYSLVTRGIEDPKGEYIGQMEGDVNNSAVLMDVDNYDSHVVIAGKSKAQTLSDWDFKGEKGVDVWGVKLGMNALLRNRRVVHLVLNRANVKGVGVDLSDVTSSVDMTRGDINPFELFGDKEDELSIFPAHLEKMSLMVEQLQPMTEDKRARIKGALQEVLNDFYVDKRMWARNAQENRDSLRLVGIPHKQVPKLPEFQAYLDMEYNAQVQARNKDPEVMNAYGFLRTAFRDMMDSNGDLFNTTTSTKIDRAAISNRVVYDFSSLIKRSRGVMMAQFVNALGFAVGNLSQGDVVILHGAEQLASGIKQYVRDKFDELQDNGVRIVSIYNSVERMLADRDLNQFESADYTLLGGMTKGTIAEYEKILKQEVPIALKTLLEHKERYRYYLRRGFDNVVFANDIQMGFNR